MSEVPRPSFPCSHSSQGQFAQGHGKYYTPGPPENGGMREHNTATGANFQGNKSMPPNVANQPPFVNMRAPLTHNITQGPPAFGQFSGIVAQNTGSMVSAGMPTNPGSIPGSGMQLTGSMLPLGRSFQLQPPSGTPMMNGPQGTQAISGQIPAPPQMSAPPFAGHIPMSGSVNPTFGQTSGPPHMSGISPPSVVNSHDNIQSNSKERPAELPVPFHGQAQYSHQLHLNTQSSTPTPSSEPHSRKSSRGPSPVSNQQYEMLEGQFSNSKPGTPQPGMQGTPPMQRSFSSPQSQTMRPPFPGQQITPGMPPAQGMQSVDQQPLHQSFLVQQPSSSGAYHLAPPHSAQTSTGPPLPGHTGGLAAGPTLHGQMGRLSTGPPLPGQTGGLATGPPRDGQTGGLSTGHPLPGQTGGLATGPPLHGQTGGLSTGPPLPGQAGGLATGPPQHGQTGGLSTGPPQPHQTKGFPTRPPLSGQTNSEFNQGTPFPGPMSGGYSGGPPPLGQQVLHQASQSGSSTGGTTQGSRRMYPQMSPSQSYGYASVPGSQSAPEGGVLNNVMQPPVGQSRMTQGQVQPNSYASGNTGMNSSFGRMHLGGDVSVVNLLHEKVLIPHEGVETPKPTLQHDFKKVNCNPDVFRSTLNAIPQSQSLLNKSRLPLGILIHPFKDLSSLPVIQSSVIVRCRSCRTYINPFVTFVDQRRWRCNLCYRVNEMPDEFTFDPVSKTYGAPERRPEIRSATVEFIAPSEYMLRPPQPAVYLFALDTSFSAVETGYLQSFCGTLLEELDRLPGDGRTKIGFITFDSAVRFYNLSEGLSTPQMLIVSDIEDVFLPSPDGLLVNLNECRDLVVELLNELPSMFQGNKETNSATGAALQAAMKLMMATGGRLTLMQGCLPNFGPGAVKSRENPNERAGKNISNLGPANDFYKKLALDCSAQQIAIDTWFLSGQYLDIATVGCASKYSGGCSYHYPGVHNVQNPAEMERYENDLRRYLTRKIGFEAVMRIRCTKGLSIHTFHGNFFVRSTDLLSLPNINPDAGFGMQISIEDSLTDYPSVSLQAALLYTSGKGERRIRVHTLCLPVTNQISEVQANADQQAVICLLAKMAVDRSMSSSFSDARDAMINACVDSLGAFGQTLPSSQRVGGLVAPYSLRLLPAYVLAMLKSVAFRVGTSTKLDDRVYAMEQCKNLPLQHLMFKLYPSLYPVHALDDKNAISKGDSTIPQPPHLHLSSAYLDRHGAYLMDTGDCFYLWIGGAVNDVFVQEVFGVPNFMSIQDGMNELPDNLNQTSENLRLFISYLQDQRPNYAKLLLIRDDSRNRMLFLQYMVEDRTESAMSYYEFLQHIQKQIK